VGRLRLLAVVASAAFLLSIGGVVTTELFFCRSYVDGSRIGWVRLRLIELESIVEFYQYEKGAPPPTLAALMPEYLKRLRDDTWNNPFVYHLLPGAKGYVLYSRGANGIDEFGRGDDITVEWKEFTCEQYQEFRWTPCQVFKTISSRTFVLMSIALMLLGVLFAIRFTGHRNA
jgi:hypothetical protein